MNNQILNIFDDLPQFPQKNELIQILSQSTNIKIERIISSGQSSPANYWYEQIQNEFVILIKGNAELEFENKTVTLKPGDYVNIPAKVRHRVKSTDKNDFTIWLAVFY